MEEPLSQERFNPLVSSVSHLHDDPIPETDSSEMEDSQPFAVALSNENEVTISETSCESDEDSESYRIRPTGNDDFASDFVEETEPSESYGSQPNRSQPEFTAYDEINIPATPSESEQEEDMSDHASGIENDSPRIVNNAFTDSPISPTNSNEISIPHSNQSGTNISFIRNDIYDETEISESDGSQRSLNQFAIDTEIHIPETPSQSDSEQDVESNQSYEVNSNQFSNESQLDSSQNAQAAFSIAMTHLDDDVVNVVANSVELNNELRRQIISPDIFDDSDDIIPNSINIAELNVAIVSPDIFEDDPVNEPHASQNAGDVPPIVHDDFPFIVPGKSRVHFTLMKIWPILNKI